MNLDQLKTFHAVANTGSFTKASRRLFLTQPAVSQQIQALEASVGVRLFDRSGKKIYLTRHGEMLLSKTTNITAELQEIEILFDELSNLGRGRLEIGTSAVFGTYYLPRPIGKFNSEYPCIDINLHSGNSHKVISMLLDNKIELGFGGLIEDEPNIAFTLIHQEPLVAVVGRNHPLAVKEKITLDDLQSLPIILREKGTRSRCDVEDWLASISADYKPERFIELENVETAKRLVEEGYGISIVPHVAVLRELHYGRLKIIDLPNLNLTASYFLYSLKKRKPSRATQTFLALFPQAIALSHAQNIALDTT
jgi:DNA-binding transcriptional LysR family regulator